MSDWMKITLLILFVLLPISIIIAFLCAHAFENKDIGTLVTIILNMIVGARAGIFVIEKGWVG